MSHLNQSTYRVRCEWGRQGLAHLAPADLVVIVDVLSFSTTVSVAVERGARVYPFHFDDPAAAVEFTQAHGAVLAGKRGDPGARFTLSPHSMLSATRDDHIVLPSPNGSTLARMALALKTDVVIGCVRNAAAIARYAEANAPASVNIIPAGERWPDGSIRFALEDWLGAGAIVSALCESSCSPEASAAGDAFRTHRERLADFVARTPSGRELVARGFAEDVDLACQFDVSACPPVSCQHGGFSAHRD